MTKNWLKRKLQKKNCRKKNTENRQWKIMVNDEVACVFAITFEDESTWKEKNINKAVYFYRIVTHPNFRGKKFVEKIIVWGKKLGKEKNLNFLRIDTWGDNDALINYYQQCGFSFLRIITPDYKNLSRHYEGINLSLFEIDLKNCPIKYNR